MGDRAEGLAQLRARERRQRRGRHDVRRLPSRLELGSAIASITESAKTPLQIGEKENRGRSIARELLVERQMRRLSAEVARFQDLQRTPPHINGGNLLPSNGAAPRSPWISPDRALRLSSSQHEVFSSGAIMRTP